MSVPDRAEPRRLAEGYTADDADDLAYWVRTLLDTLEQAEEWADGQSYPLITRQAEILTGVANALNGQPPPLTSWSHHDLAEKAAAMVARAEQAEARIQAVEATLRTWATYCQTEQTARALTDIRRALDA